MSQHEREHTALVQFALLPSWLLLVVGSESPTAATIPSSYRNAYRSCTGRLSVDISANEAATACAGTAWDLSRCVVEIKADKRPAGCS